jgi:hypothetical protein
MTHTLFNIEKILINVSTISDVQKLVLYPRVVIIGSSDPVYTVPDEFGTGLKFVLFPPVYTRIRSVRESQIHPVPWFSCVYTAETDEFQPGSKFVRHRVNGALSKRRFCQHGRQIAEGDWIKTVFVSVCQVIFNRYEKT